MSEKTIIEWTQSTWNPVTGCTKMSAGCVHCYAEAFAERFRGVPGHPYEQGFDLKLWPERLDLPLRWKQPRAVFVNSMSDLFHPEVPDAFIFAVFEVIRRADRHTFQVLTKRPERAAQLSPKLPWPDNLWMGTTVEKQRYVDRIKPLLMTGARVKFLSCEPLIGPLRMDLSGIHWVIVGGESGPRARPMRVEWARDIRGQCEQDQALFFFKQWGSHGPDGRYVGRKRAGRLLDGRTWDGMPPLLAAQARAFL